MDFGDILSISQGKTNNGSMEGSMSIGELQDLSGSLVASGTGECPVPEIPAPEGFVQSLFSRVKTLVQKQDDQDNANNLDVSDASHGSLGDSGQNVMNRMQMSAAQQSSSHVAGGFFMPQASFKQ